MGLPNGYTELEYIQSSGTQYIDTGFKPNQNTRVIMDCNIIGFSARDMFLFGARVASGNTAFSVAVDDANTKWFVLYGNTVKNPAVACLGHHIVDFNKNVFLLDGAKTTFDISTFQSTYNMLLFATITGGSVDNQQGSMSLSICKIYDNGTLIRNFVPCRNQSGIVGLYDLVNSKFYGNSGTGTFIAGTPKVKLPSGYRQVEYISSSGSSYANTEVVPKPDTRVCCSCEITKSETWKGIFGSRNAANDAEFAVDMPSGTKIRSAYGDATKEVTVSTVLQKFEIDKNGKTCTVNGSIMENDVKTFTSNYPIWLFDKNTTGNKWGPISMRLFSCRIYDNGTLVRDFIPCTDSSGVAGLYDLVNKKFYKSITATAFVAGPLVSFKKGDSIIYNYTGKSQTLRLPKGTYKLECWGAQGGSYNANYKGGLGGYSVGVLTLEEDTNIGIYVGGQPAAVTTDRAVCPGGWNGGGAGFNRYYSGTYSYGQGGGGASDIRINGTTLYARLIVAGGGGGSSSQDDSKTKYGGGLTGGCAINGGGGTQKNGGSATNMTAGTFGNGASTTTSGDNYKYGSGGGGGGWYGGGACSTYNDSTNFRPYNGGGSGYVYTAETAANYPTGCLLNSKYHLSDAQTIGGNQAFPNPSGGTENGHSGNGCVRITVLAIDSLNIPIKVNDSWHDMDAIYMKVNGTWKEIETVNTKIAGEWKEVS